VATLTSGGVSEAASAHASSSLVVSVLKTSTYGTVLQSTRTVYTLTPSKVACTATCLTSWPEVLLPRGATKATAAHGVNGAKLGTIPRAGGRLQVTYAGQALYWFALDKRPGQVKGNVSDKWGKWSVVVLVKPTAGGSPTTTTTTGGGGGGIGF
jgi:predicted lipoprotein with Yx(FWY)xxD motif